MSLCAAGTESSLDFSDRYMKPGFSQLATYRLPCSLALKCALISSIIAFLFILLDGNTPNYYFLFPP